MAAIPRGVLESALNLDDRAHDDALAQDITGQTARLQRQQAMQPPTPQWSLPSLDALLGGGTTQPAPETQPQQQAVPTQPVQQEQRTQGWQLPSLDVLLGRDPNAAQSQQPASPGVPSRPFASPGGAPMAMPTTGGAISQEPGDLRAWARQEAVRLGIDPDIAERVAMSEGGFDDPVRQSDVVYQGEREQSYGPYQLNVNGGLWNEAIARGIDPRNPAHARAAVTFALEHAARNGWGNFHGAARVGVGERDGIGQAPAQRPGMTTPPQAEQTPAAQAQAQYDPANLVPNQITESTNAGLDWDTALATCGVAAAVAFARANGRTPTWQEAMQLAEASGWNKDVGMSRGTAGQIELLDRLGVKARAGRLDESTIAATVQAGQPVIVNAHGNGGHFYVATQYDPSTRKFNFGNSAAVLKRSGGQTWFRLDELPALGVGTPSEAIYMGAN